MSNNLESIHQQLAQLKKGVRFLSQEIERVQKLLPSLPIDAPELSRRLLELEEETSNHKQEQLFNQLKAELQRDGLELHVDEQNCFAVRLEQVEV